MERIVEELTNYNYVNGVGLSEEEIIEVAEKYFDEHHDFDKEFETGILDFEFERLIEARFNQEVIDRENLPFLPTKLKESDKKGLYEIIDYSEDREYQYVDMMDYARQYTRKHSR